MHILITGAGGFIGRATVRAAVAAGHQVTALTRRPLAGLPPDVTILPRDILDISAADLPDGLDAVIHLATGTDGDRNAINRVAVDGARQLLAAAKAKDVARFIHISSMSVYPGRPGPDGRYGETRLEPRPAARGAYAESKVLQEQAVRAFARQDGLAAMALDILRPGLVFDTDMPGPLAGTAVVLPLGLAVITGRGGGGVPFVTLEDLIQGTLALLARPTTPGTTRTFDVLSGPPPTKRDFTAAYDQMTGRAHRRLALPAWVLLAAAWPLELILRAVGKGRDLPYKITRMWAFDPSRLDHAAVWQATGSQPTGQWRPALARALALPRDPAPPADSASALRQRAQALARLGVPGDISVQDTTPGDAPVPVILVGAGRIVEEMHLPAIAALGKAVQVIAVVDPSSARARQVADRLAALHPQAAMPALFAALSHMPAEMAAGALGVIATPEFAHLANVRDLAAKGALSFIMEKPVAATAATLTDLTRVAGDHRISLIHNYRLRPNVLRLWRFLNDHDTGPLVSARVLFHSGRVAGEPARWSRDEKRRRTLLMELAIHFLDIALVCAGPITRTHGARVVNRQGGHMPAVVHTAGLAETAGGATLSYDLDLSATAQESAIVLEFSHTAVRLDFFPEGFRVLPARANPLDDAAAALGRFAGFVGQRLRPRRGGIERRAMP
ncbi:MAG: NAD-dependent epimerase/dehydratase family protein, partial [Alphaproteobacteria bacterium]